VKRRPLIFFLLFLAPTACTIPAHKDAVGTTSWPAVEKARPAVKYDKVMAQKLNKLQHQFNILEDKIREQEAKLKELRFNLFKEKKDNKRLKKAGKLLKEENIALKEKGNKLQLTLKRLNRLDREMERKRQTMK